MAHLPITLGFTPPCISLICNWLHRFDLWAVYLHSLIPPLLLKPSRSRLPRQSLVPPLRFLVIPDTLRPLRLILRRNAPPLLSELGRVRRRRVVRGLRGDLLQGRGALQGLHLLEQGGVGRVMGFGVGRLLHEIVNQN